MKITGKKVVKSLSVISWAILAVCFFIVITQSGIITALSLLVGILVSIVIELLRYYGESYEKTDEEGRK